MYFDEKDLEQSFRELDELINRRVKVATARTREEGETSSMTTYNIEKGICLTLGLPGDVPYQEEEADEKWFDTARHLLTYLERRGIHSTRYSYLNDTHKGERLSMVGRVKSMLSSYIDKKLMITHAK